MRKPKRKATLPQQQAGTGTGPPLTGAAAQLFFPEFAYLLEAVTAAKRAAQLAQRPARAAGRRAGPLASVMDWRDAAAAAQADGDAGVEAEAEAGGCCGCRRPGRGCVVSIDHTIVSCSGKQWTMLAMPILVCINHSLCLILCQPVTGLDPVQVNANA